MKYKCKRERQLPSYSIHCDVPKPPCPQYNIVQPTDDEGVSNVILCHVASLHHIVLNTTVQAYKSLVNKTDPNIDGPNSVNSDVNNSSRPSVSVNNIRPSIGDSQCGWSYNTNIATPSPVHEAAR